MAQLVKFLLQKHVGLSLARERWGWWHVIVIPELRRDRQADSWDLSTSLAYLESFRTQ